MADGSALPRAARRRVGRAERRRLRRAARRESEIESRAASCDGPPAFPMKRLTYRKFRGAVARELWLLAKSLPRGKTRRAYLRRARRVSECGTVVRVRQCAECGECRPGSGVVGSYHARCESRSCPVCARARSAGVREWLGRALNRAHARMVQAQGGDDGRRWRHVTMTLQRDVSDPDQHTPELLRARLRALQAAWRELWQSWKDIPGAAAMLTIEIAGTGNVHAHGLVLGPRSIAKKWVSETVGWHARACNTATHPWVDIRSIEHGEAIQELGAYHAKVPSILTERWLAGHPVETMHPALAARWELATYGQRLRERYGTLREVPLDETTRHGESILLSAEERAEADAQLHCDDCGSVDSWRWTLWRGTVGSWVGYCWARGGAAIARPLARSDVPDESEAAAIEDKSDVALQKSHQRGRVRAWWAQPKPKA